MSVVTFRLTVLSVSMAILGVFAAASASAQTGQCGVAGAGSLPDFIVDAQDLTARLVVSYEKFAPTSCAVVEEFVNSPGPHQLLRFTTTTPNIGAGALVIGDPAQCPALYEFSPCHGHYHFHGYAVYRLWTEAGYANWVTNRDLTQPTNGGSNALLLTKAEKTKDLLLGRKQGFCFRDDVKFLPTASDTPAFVNCMDNQGLSPGWSDVYDYRLDGQYVQIDNLKSGVYVIENHVNPEHELPESNYSNNTAAVRFRFTAGKGSTPATVEVLEVIQ